MSPAGGLLDVDALQAVEGEELGDLGLAGHVPSSLQTDDRVADLHAAVEDAADGDAAEVVARVEVGDEHLQRRVGVAARRRHVLDDRVEQRPQILAGLVADRGVAVPARAFV